MRILYDNFFLYNTYVFFYVLLVTNLIFNRHLHLELCQISRELNGIFGIWMTLEMINCIICLMRHCWYLYIHVRTKTFLILTPFSWLDIQMWMLLNGSRIFCLNYACQSVSAKVNFCINLNKYAYLY